MYFSHSFLGFFFLVRFILIRAFAYSSSAFLSLHRHRFVSCYITIVFFSLSSFVIDPLLWSSDKHIIFHVFRRHRHHSCSVVLFVLLLFCTITCFATITYYFSLHTIMSHGIMTHYYTVEISMDICCLSGKSICTSSLNFFIANPFGDFGDRPFPTKSRAA